MHINKSNNACASYLFLLGQIYNFRITTQKA